MLVDFHSHSTFSDGTLSAEEMVAARSTSMSALTSSRIVCAIWTVLG